MKRIVLLNGSPRPTERTASEGFLAHAERILGGEFETLPVRIRASLKAGPETDFEKLLEADAVILAFPLYYFCLPGLLMRFLEDYERYAKERGGQKKPAMIYAVVNCGFPEPEINAEAVRVVGCFSRRIGARFRFGVLIGGGPMLAAAEKAGPVKKAYARLDAAMETMARDIRGGGESPAPESVLIRPGFPRRLYLLMGGMSWKRQAKKNGLKKADLYRRPYQSAE